MTDSTQEREGSGELAPEDRTPATDPGPPGPRRADRGGGLTRGEIEAGIAAARGHAPGETRDEDVPPWTWGAGRRRGAWGGGRRHRRGPWGPPWDATGPRPEWWPENQAWPARRHRPWRGFGCLFGVLFLAGVLGLLSLGAAVVGHVVATPGPFGLLIRLASLALVVAVVVGLGRTARAIRGSGTVLDALVEQAARVESGDYAARVETSGPVPPPVRALARGFNTMAARLEADEAQRRTLLADVTHELRTPLAVVRGNVEAILDGIHPADDAHLTAILDEAHVLDRLIEDLRTLALSESGGLSLHREPTDLAVLATDVATSFQGAASTAGVEIEAAVDEAVPLLDVDPVRIREILANLVANGLRHTPAGGVVSISARPATVKPAAAASSPAARPREEIEIVVRDTGSGIDPELLPHVFERFTRGSGSTGSGLGLAIARGLVELHDGSITAVAPADGGTQIVIRLPLRAAG